MSTESDLRAEFTAWLAQHGFDASRASDPGEGADGLIEELDYARASSESAFEIGEITLQIRWLRDFVDRWDKAGPVET